jgi:hypothetical protein
MADANEKPDRATVIGLCFLLTPRYSNSIHAIGQCGSQPDRPSANHQSISHLPYAISHPPIFVEGR